MDNLTIRYFGNRPSAISESAVDNNASGSFEYKKANGIYFKYNTNGALVTDKNRGIAYITYDYNNNPKQIYFTNGSVTKYIYSASGQKLRVVHYTAKPNITRTCGTKPAELTLAQILQVDSTDYLLGGSLVMKNGKVDKYLFEGGYCQASSLGSSTDTFASYFYNQDHLGNIREVVDASGAVKQVTNYYPFGTPCFDASSTQNADMQPYKYNGKELDRMHGLDSYDYGARQYDPILARWDRIDPLCEKYYSVSPYAYCLNNPIRLIDIKGMKPGDFFRTPDAAAKDFGYCYNGASIIKNREYGTMIFQVVNSKNEIGYTYNIPTVGTDDGVAIDPAPAGYRVVATAHTHGKYVEAMDGYNKNYNDEFSGLRMSGSGTFFSKENRMAVSSISDIGNANTSKLNCYVATPNGSLQKYDYKTGDISIISNDMPSDKNDPDRLNNREATDATSNMDLLQLLRKLIYQQF